jgi:hypothetical protein
MPLALPLVSAAAVVMVSVLIDNVQIQDAKISFWSHPHENRWYFRFN